jgi:hypothetical protein
MIPYFFIRNGEDRVRWFESDSKAIKVYCRWIRLTWDRYVDSLHPGSMARGYAKNLMGKLNYIIRLSETYPGSGVIAVNGRELIYKEDFDVKDD